MTIHTLGYPRIGRNREMKFAVEKYWKGKINETALLETARTIRRQRWQTQAETGVTIVPVCDFPLYDHVLQMSMALGVIPHRFRAGRAARSLSPIDLEFAVARGLTGTSASSDTNIEPSAMTKWFDTNYHYIVPELDTPDTPAGPFTPDPSRLVTETREALEAGYTPKPVLVGPVTYLYLAGASPSLAPQIATAYRTITDALAPYAPWIQYDEPVLALDLTPEWQQAFRDAYATLTAGSGPHKGGKLLIATYFGPLEDNLTLLLDLPVDGYHLDAVRGPDDITPAATALKDHQILSVGIVNGRNIWRNDIAASLEVLTPLYRQLKERLWIAPSCSLLHVPIDTTTETQLPPELHGTLAFADQKLQELAALKDHLEHGTTAPSSRAAQPTGTDIAPDTELEALARRKAPFKTRRKVQQQRFNLPAYPTTTIGSFPQTAHIRATRRAFRTGEITEAEYTRLIQQEIAETIKKQEEIGLDVLVHGEAERTDMVEYFGRQLDGFAFTTNGWVQSYGTRCVKPPIIHADVDRPAAITVPWITYAQSLTDKPVKGMLTGPITILQWSFVREDQPRRDTALQIALALRKEVQDLEHAGIGIIQVDEPALREGLPLRKSEWDTYLTWATLAFRLATSSVTNQTQIHTHMCYSQFNEIIQAIASLDADVITIEAARSRMRLLQAFTDYAYPNDIGPGIYDIHSPLIPSTDSMVDLLEQARARIPAAQLWVNPDCGLKTRTWSEVEPSLRNMVAAADHMRRKQGV